MQTINDPSVITRQIQSALRTIKLARKRKETAIVKEMEQHLNDLVWSDDRDVIDLPIAV